MTEQEVIDGLRNYYRQLDASAPARTPAWDPADRRDLSVGSWRTQLFATAALLMLLIGAAILIQQARAIKPTNVTTTPIATPDARLKPYQALVASDERSLSATSGITLRLYPSPLDCSCPAAITGVKNAAQHWLDDLAASRPPARFATVESELRRNLTRLITDTDTVLHSLADNAQPELDRARQSAMVEAQLAEDEGYDIAYAAPGSISAHASQLRSQLSGLQSCATCLTALRQPDQDCIADPGLCVVNLKTLQASIDEAQASSLRPYTQPSPSMDLTIQASLSTADRAIDDMIAVLETPGSPAATRLAGAHRTLASAVNRLTQDVKRFPN